MRARFKFEMRALISKYPDVRTYVLEQSKAITAFEVKV